MYVPRYGIGNPNNVPPQCGLRFLYSIWYSCPPQAKAAIAPSRRKYPGARTTRVWGMMSEAEAAWKQEADCGSIGAGLADLGHVAHELISKNSVCALSRTPGAIRGNNLHWRLGGLMAGAKRWDYNTLCNTQRSLSRSRDRRKLSKTRDGPGEAAVETAS